MPKLPAKDERLDAPGPVPDDNRAGHRPRVVPDKPVVPPDAYRVADPPDLDPDAPDVDEVRYPFVFDPLLVPFAIAVGVLPATTWLRFDDEWLDIRFGPWSLRTARDNVAGCEVTGPYRAIKVAGPPHLSLADLGVTFATNRRQGACIRFHEPVPALVPFGLVRHPAATVTVSNPADLARRLARD
jgi:hypothetical protein